MTNRHTPKLDPLYERLTHSPELNSSMCALLDRLLAPDELIEEVRALVALASARPEIRLEEITFGVSTSGRALIGWRLKRAGSVEKPIILSASQHHGPENCGASVALYFSYLLILDDRWSTLLDDYQFVFFPQQNPDALDLRGNLDWMSAREDIIDFVSHHQYDPRSLDVEHGVPSSLFMMSVEERARLKRDPDLLYQGFQRPETRALIEWIDATIDAGGVIHTYLSGHAWDLLNGPLYLISGAERSHQHQRDWIEHVMRWSDHAPLSLNAAPPLSSDYVLRPPQSLNSSSVSDHDHHMSSALRGVYQAPRLEDFQSLNQQSGVMYSTLAYVESRAPNAVVVVLEPPILQVSTPESIVGSLIEYRERLLKACALHDEMIKLVTQREAWAPTRWRRADLEASMLSEGGGGDDALQARVILEVMEQESTRAVWETFFQRLDTGKIGLSVSAEQLILATAGQRFATANLVAQLLKLSERSPSATLLEDLDLSSLRATYDRALSDLEEYELRHVDGRAASFVYLAALLSAAGVS